MSKAKKKEPSYDERIRNYFGHQAMNLRAREALKEAGMPDDQLPMADYRFDSAAERIEESNRRRKPKKMAKGGKLPDLTGDGKVTRADVLKGRGVKGFAKGGSTASKRGDGCATKGKTKGRFV